MFNGSGRFVIGRDRERRAEIFLSDQFAPVTELGTLLNVPTRFTETLRPRTACIDRSPSDGLTYMEMVAGNNKRLRAEFLRRRFTLSSRYYPGRILNQLRWDGGIKNFHELFPFGFMQSVA